MPALFKLPGALPPTLAVLLALAAADPAAAQTRPGTLGVGGQIGDPSGLTVKYYTGAATAYDALAAWDLDDFFFLNVHRLQERRLDDSPLTAYYGPGVVFGVQERSGDTDVVLGASASAGLNFFTERFEVFLQLTPRLDLLPATRAHLGGGVGLRYYWR